jgi:UDP-glucose 4-epimerase
LTIYLAVSKNLPSGAFVHGSVTDHDLSQALRASIQYAYHAAYAAEGLSHFIRRFATNNDGA